MSKQNAELAVMMAKVINEGAASTKEGGEASIAADIAKTREDAAKEADDTTSLASNISHDSAASNEKRGVNIERINALELEVRLLKFDVAFLQVERMRDATAREKTLLEENQKLRADLKDSQEQNARTKRILESMERQFSARQAGVAAAQGVTVQQIAARSGAAATAANGTSVSYRSQI